MVSLAFTVGIGRLELYRISLRNVIVVVEFGQAALFTKVPLFVAVSRDEDHVVGIYSTPWRESYADNDEHRREDLITYFDKVILPVASIDPSYQENYPRSAPKCDDESIERDKESKSWHVLAW